MSKEEKARRERERYHSNRESINSGRKETLQLNKDEVNANRRAARAANPEHTRQQLKEYRDANRTQLNTARRDARASNPEHTRQQLQEYRDANRTQLNSARRAARAANREHTNNLQQGYRNTNQTRSTDFNLDQENFILTTEQLTEITKAMKNEISNPQGNKQEVFSDSHTNLLKATVLFYMNSGCSRFDEWKFHSKAFENSAINIAMLKEEITNESLTELELKNMMKTFAKKHNYVPPSLYACGACGVRSYDEKFQLVDLTSSNVQKFRYTLEEQLKMKNRLAYGNYVKVYTSPTTSDMINPWRTTSVYESNDGNLYYLHPELVKLDEESNIESTYLCKDCFPNKTDKDGMAILPERSIAAGVDFGCYRRIGLIPLNLQEQCLISLVRLYMTVYKVSSNIEGRININLNHSLKAHAIMFAHDAPFVAAKCINNQTKMLHQKTFLNTMHITFIDDKGKFDTNAKRQMGSAQFFPRWWQLASYLRVLKAINPLYQGVDFPGDGELQNACISAQNTLCTTATIIDEAALIHQENTIGSDMTETVQADSNSASAMNLNQFQTNSNDFSCGPPRISYVLNTFKAGSTIHNYHHNQQILHSLRDLNQSQDDSNADLNDETIANYITQDELQDSVTAVNAFLNRSQREGAPINEFADRDLLAKAFPSTFLFGTAYPSKGVNLSSRETLHLLRQFSNIPAKDMRLLGYLEDFKTRLQNINGVNSRVRSNPSSVATVSDLLTDSTAKEELQVAINYPKSDHAKRVLKKYLPHLQFSGKKVGYGLFETWRLKGECMETCRRHGPPVAFLTLSFNMIDNPRAFRASFHTVNNDTFPATFHDGCPYGDSANAFLQQLRNNSILVDSQHYIPSHMNASARAKAAMENPVAYVEETKSLLAHVLSFLLGMPPEHFFERNAVTSRRSEVPYMHSKGILGHLFAVKGVIEDHAKGTLHAHLLCFGGISSFAMQTYASIPTLCTQMAHVLDTQFQTKLPDKVLLAHLVKQYIKYKVPGYMIHQLFPSILNQANMASIATHARNNQTSLQADICQEVTQTASNKWHSHTFTCRKGTMGKSGCRLCYPRANIPETTPVHLIPNPEKKPGDTDPTIPYYKVKMLELNDTPPTYILKPILSYHSPTDVIVWETARPLCSPLLNIDELSKEAIVEKIKTLLKDELELRNWQQFWDWLQDSSEESIIDFYKTISSQLDSANGNIPSFNSIISYMTGSHNNIELLGSRVQAAGATFYICPYMAKDKTPMLESLVVLQNAAKYIAENPSTATDSGIASRNAKYLLQRVLNKLHLKQELSIYQITAKLLQLPSVITTETYAFLCPHAEHAASNALKHPEGSVAKMSLSPDEYKETFLQKDLEEPHDITDSDDSDSEDSMNSFIDDSGNPDEDQQNINTPEEEQQQQNDIASPLSIHDLLKNVGSFRSYNIEKEIDDFGQVVNQVQKFIPYSLLYSNRGKQLRHLNRYELTALVKIREKPKNDETARSKLFDMAPSFPLSARYAFALQQKHSTPFLTSKMPPHPGSRPANPDATWQTKANKFAAYLLTVYRPEVNFYDAHSQTNPYDYTYEALENWIVSLQNDSNVISKFRLMMVDRCITRMKCRMIVKRMLCDYRGRTRQEWQETQGNVFSQTPQQANIFQADVDIELNQPLSAKSMAKRLEQARFLSLNTKAFCSIHPFQNNSASTTSLINTSNPEYTSATWPVDDLQERLQQTVNCLKNENMYEDLFHRQQEPGPTSQPSRLTNYDSTSTATLTETVTLNAKQQHFFDCVTSHMGHPPTNSTFPCLHLPPITLLTGNAGTGKSVVIAQISAFCEQHNIKIFKTAYNAINALHIQGETTASAVNFTLHDRKNKIVSLSHNDLKNFRQVTGIGNSVNENPVRLIIFDEVSNQAPWYLSNFSAACKQSTNCSLEFGGIPTVLIGDLKQMGPVLAGYTLTQAITRTLAQEFRELLASTVYKVPKRLINPSEDDKKQIGANHPVRLGAEIIMQSRWFHLDEQVRAAQDHEHAKVVSHMASDYMLPHDIFDIYSQLSKNDMKKEEWARAPMIVTTNAERLLFLHHRSLTYAKVTNNIVVRWLANHTSGETLPGNEEEICHYEYFVKGADGFLTTRISRPLGLVNAQKIVYHSLVFATEQDRQTVDNACANGDILVTISTTPLAINVEIEEAVLSSMDHRKVKALRNLSISDDNVTTFPNEGQPPIKKIVLPITPKASDKTHHMLCTASPLDPSLDKCVKPFFPVEMWFAMTVNKSEGQTMPRVIIALSQRPTMNYTRAGLYVAFSRVKHSSHLRLFITGHTEDERRHNMNYIWNLPPDLTVKSFFKGFKPTDDESPWQTISFNRRLSAIQIRENYYGPTQICKHRRR